MLSVRVAAALARTLPRRAGFVSSSNLAVFGFCRHVAPIYDVARMNRRGGVRISCTRIWTGGHRALHGLAGFYMCWRHTTHTLIKLTGNV